jgi:PAS domain S-box-containing protein
MRNLSKMTKAELLNEIQVLEQRVAVLESEEHFRLLAETAPVGIILHKDEEIFYTNPAATKLLGASDPKELIGRNILDHIHPDYKPMVLTRARSVREQNLVAPLVEEKYLRLDGTAVDVEVTATPFGALGKRMFQVIINDITERKLTQELIRLRLSLMEFAVTHELDELLQKTLDEIEGLTNSSISFFHFVESDQRTLSLQAWSTRTQNEFCEAQGKGLHYPVDEAGVWADCVRERRAVIHNDYQSLPHRKGLPEGHAKVIRELVVPILKGDRIVAILGVGNKPQNFTEKDVELVSYLADVAWEITERKRMETALRESEERYRTFVEDLPIGVYRTTPGSQGKHLIANSYYLRMFGYDSLEELVKKVNVSDMYVDPAERKSFSDNLLANRHVDRTELHLKRSDGTPVWGAVTASVAYDKGGEPYFDCAIEDITERKQTEEALRLTRFTVDSVADAVYWIDPQGQIVDVNETACRMLGYTYEELTAMSLTGIDPDFSLAQWPNTWKNIKEAGKLTLEAQHRTKVGRLVPVEVMANYINFGGRELDCAVVRDITERKRAEEEITSLARFPKENPSPVLRLDADGTVLFANPASEPILESWGCAAGQRVPEQWCKVTKEVLTNHISRTLDVDCNGRVFSLVAAPIASMNYVNLYAQDITERKKAEEILQMFQYSNDQASVAIFWMNRDAEYLYVNDEACRSLGYTREELLSLCLWDIDPYYPKELWDSNWEQYQEDRQGGGEHIETFHRRKDGVTFPVEVFSRHLWLGENEFHVAFVQDTTERKQVEAELRTSEARYRALVESQVDLISRYRPDTKLTFVNDAYCQFYGKTREELIGNSFLSMVAPEFHEQALKETENFVKDPRPVGGEYLNYRWDGQECWIHWVIQGIEDENGRVLELQATGRDVTPLKQAEEKIRQLNDELEQRVVERTAQLEAANKELEAFSYSVSHDLRAPLRAIDGFSRILIEDHASRLPDEVVRLLGIVRDNTQQMGRLIDDLLAFSRLSRQPVNMRTVDTADLVRQVLETLQNDLEGREVVIEVGDLPACQGDPTLLKQVWMNLLSNALKFTRVQESPRIEIGCEEKDGEKIYFVKDNGVGFDMRYVDKLFGVFQRLHRSDEFEGTGVGLAIVQRILHRHGGRVWTEAEPNVGATFFFTI